MDINESFWSRVDQTGGCWTYTGVRDRWGYGTVYLFGASVGAHRLAWELHNGPIPAGMHVLHHCDNPPCCNPAHLFLGTHQDNMADKGAKGRSGGAATTVLAPEQVREIRRRATGRRGEQTEMAFEYGVSQSQISRIIHGRRRGSIGAA